MGIVLDDGDFTSFVVCNIQRQDGDSANCRGLRRVVGRASRRRLGKDQAFHREIDPRTIEAKPSHRPSSLSLNEAVKDVHRHVAYRESLLYLYDVYVDNRATMM